MQQGPPQYGRWVWDGRRWMPAVEQRPGAPYGNAAPGPPARSPRRPPVWLWGVGAAVIVLVLVTAAGGLALVRGTVSNHGSAGWGDPARVSAAVARQGLTCGQSLVLRPSTTICHREQGGRAIMVGATTSGFVVQARAHASNLFPGASASTVDFSKPVFEAMVAGASDSDHLGPAQRWLQSKLGSSHHTNFGPSRDGQVLSILLTTDSYGGTSIFVGVTRSAGDTGASPKGTSLPNVTTSSADAYFSKSGLACDGVDQGVDFCSADPLDYYAEASADLDPSGDAQSDRELHVTVISGPNDLSSIVEARMNEIAPGMLALVFTSASDLRRVTAWMRDNLSAWSPTQGFHNIVVRGVTVGLVPFNGKQDNGQPAIGWRLNVDVAAF